MTKAPPTSTIAFLLVALTWCCVSTAFSPATLNVKPSICTNVRAGTTKVSILPLITTNPSNHCRLAASLERSRRRPLLNRKNGDAIALSASTTASSELDESGDNKQVEKVGIRQRISSYFKGSDNDDGLTFKERLAKMGLATVLSYGFVSNVNSMVLTVCSWYVFSLRTKMSPLWPGQWKPFLGVYAGFYVISNLMRPIRVTAAVAISPYFDRLVNWVQRKTKLPKAASVTATVLLVNLVGTTILFAGGISLASLFSGVAIFPPKA